MLYYFSYFPAGAPHKTDPNKSVFSKTSSNLVLSEPDCRREEGSGEPNGGGMMMLLNVLITRLYFNQTINSTKLQNLHGNKSLPGK